MNLIDFTYYCVYTVIPDKATLGKDTGASGLHSSMSSFFYLGLVFWTDFLIKDFKILTSSTLLAVIITIFGGHFIFNWRYFLREEKQKALAEKYGHIKKWKLKLVGIFFLLFCFFFFIFSSLRISIIKSKTASY